MPARSFSKRPSFQNIWRKYHISVYFLRKIILHFPSGGKIIFSGKRNIIFPDNTKKFTFQRELFGKTIFSGRLEKQKYDFPCSERHISWSSNRLVESTKFTEANNMFLFTLFSYLLSPYKINLVKNI